MDQHQRDIMNRWYADIYDQNETQTDDVECLRSLIGTQPKRVLEVACGTGRICVPLARAGHDVDGFDMDEAMLARALRKAEDLPNLRCFALDALAADWGRGYDVVVMAGNLFINIATDGDYSRAQRALLEKARRSLNEGGHLYLDFDCVDWPDAPVEPRREWVCFEGTDAWGTYGKFIVVGGGYDSRARRDIDSRRRYEIVPKGSAPFSFERVWNKHFPALGQACGWLHDAGFAIEQLYGGHDRQPFDDHNRRAVIWARKNGLPRAD